MVPSPGAISVTAERVDLVEGICASGGGCGAGGLPITVGVVVVVLLAVIGVVATLRAVSKAGAVVAEERERTRAERDAFASFERRVAGLTAAQPMSTPGDIGTMAVGSGRAGGELERLKDAYQETVMDVSHYEEEYDEPIQVNMTAELGEEAAVAVFDGPGLTPQLKQALRHQATEAQDRRDALLDALDREEERLGVAREKLTDVETELERASTEPMVDRSYAELTSQWQRLADLEDSCRRLLEKHQHPSIDRPSNSYDGTTMREYLYGHLSTTHPVLSDATRLVQNIRDARERTMRALTRRV